ncbi:MAG: hypothetical protein OEV36_11745, partial [Myxococcales bacterium]|nr:hypothetical protein [Myxococcales bacterium]
VLCSTPVERGSLVEVRADNARRHQIRVHLASIGHPLLGDTLYGGPALENLDRHLLHAVSISFTIGTRHTVVTSRNHMISELESTHPDG